jgi:hypothetical protein
MTKAVVLGRRAIILWLMPASTGKSRGHVSRLSPVGASSHACSAAKGEFAA